MTRVCDDCVIGVSHERERERERQNGANFDEKWVKWDVVQNMSNLTSKLTLTKGMKNRKNVKSKMMKVYVSIVLHYLFESKDCD